MGQLKQGKNSKSQVTDKWQLSDIPQSLIPIKEDVRK